MFQASLIQANIKKMKDKSYKILEELLGCKTVEVKPSNWVFEFRNEWKQLKGRYNWYSFTPIYIMFEKEGYTGGVEFWFMLLGFGFYIRYNYDTTKLDSIIEKAETKIKSDELLISLMDYLAENPDLRFWQGLKEWSNWNYILKSTHFDSEMFNKKWLKDNNVKIQDTFYE